MYMECFKIISYFFWVKFYIEFFWLKTGWIGIINYKFWKEIKLQVYMKCVYIFSP